MNLGGKHSSTVCASIGVPDRTPVSIATISRQHRSAGNTWVLIFDAVALISNLSIFDFRVILCNFAK